MDKYEPNGSTSAKIDKMYVPAGRGRGRPPGTSNDKRYPDCVVFATGGGGLGKIIQSTAVFRSIVEATSTVQHMPIYHVVTPHTSPYAGNPSNSIIHNAGMCPNLYESILRDYPLAQIAWYQAEPYHHRRYISAEMHLINAWRDRLGLEQEKSVQPTIHLTNAEMRDGRDYCRSTDKPVLLMQITGGPVQYQREKDGTLAILPPTYERNLPTSIAQAVVNELFSEYVILQVSKRGQPQLANTVQLQDVDERKLYAIIANANVVLCIDSFVQHAAAALGKKAIVLWGATRPQCLGYSTHVNLWRTACPTPLCNRPNSYLHDTDCNGKPWQCPHGAPCLQHDVQNILDAVEAY